MRLIWSTKGTRMPSRRMARGMGGAAARRCRRRSTTTSPAGKTVIMATHESRMAVPEMKPSSWSPRKSVSMRTKNVPAAVTAPSSMPGPLRAAVISMASRRLRPRNSSSS
jgi:hypothetical protein